VSVTAEHASQNFCFVAQLYKSAS